MTGLVIPAGSLVPVGELDRTTYLGSSDVAAICGLEPTRTTRDGKKVRRTAYTVYLAKRGELEGTMDPETKLFLRRRKRWEGPIREMLREEYHGDIVAENQRYLDPEYPFMAAEIDFEWRDSDEVIQNGEIKTASSFVFNERHGWGESGTGDVPIEYACQISFGLMVTRRQRCVVAVLVGLDDMIFYVVERDDDFITDIRERCRYFWTEHVLKGVPPKPVSPMDQRHAMLKMRGRPVQLDNTHLGKLHRLEEVRGSLKSLADEEENLAFELGDFVCNSWASPNPYYPPALSKAEKKKLKFPDVMMDAGLYYGGRRVGSWNKQEGAYLDQKTLKEDHSALVSEYMKSTQFRVLRFHKPKE